MCYKNIYEFAYKKYIASLSTKNFTKSTLKNILEILHFERINKDIIFECNDIKSTLTTQICNYAKKSPRLLCL